MIRLVATNNLNKLENQLNNFHNNVQEVISRVFMESIDQVKSELALTFGGAIDYADFSINYDGDKISLTVSDLNEFVLLNESDSTAQDVLEMATSILSGIITQELAKAQLIGGSQ